MDRELRIFRDDRYYVQIIINGGVTDVKAFESVDEVSRFITEFYGG